MPGSRVGGCSQQWIHPGIPQHVLDVQDNSVGAELCLSGDPRWFGVVKTLLLPRNEGVCGNSVKNIVILFLLLCKKQSCGNFDVQWDELAAKRCISTPIYTLRCSELVFSKEYFPELSTCVKYHVNHCYSFSTTEGKSSCLALPVLLLALQLLRIWRVAWINPIPKGLQLEMETLAQCPSPWGFLPVL